MTDGSLGLEIHTHWGVNHHVLHSNWLGGSCNAPTPGWPLVILIDSTVKDAFRTFFYLFLALHLSLPTPPTPAFPPFTHRKSPPLPRPRRPCARCCTPGYGSIRFPSCKPPLSFVIVAGRTAIAFFLFPPSPLLPSLLVRSIFVLHSLI